MKTDIYSPPFWELRRGGGPITELIRRYKALQDKPARVGRPSYVAFIREGGDGNRWVRPQELLE